MRAWRAQAREDGPIGAAGFLDLAGQDALLWTVRSVSAATGELTLRRSP
ncbi:MAG: hypothetical protein K2W96_01310 [Gemmataceae bacterium]|nr:hypothetical protein [Gemmataceae bacterium]